MRSDFYKHFAEERVTRFGNKRRIRFEKMIFDETTKYLGKRARVMEIGPGNGGFANLCRQNGFEFWGVEASDILYEKLISKGFNIKKGFVPPIPFESKRFDLVYASMVLEHMASSYEAFRLLEESNRVLKKGGYISLVFPNFLRIKLYFFDCDYTHNFVTTTRRISQMLCDAGFQVLEIFNLIGPMSGLPERVLKYSTGFVYWTWITILLEALGQGEFMHKVKKSLTEAVLVIGKKGAPEQTPGDELRER